MSPTTTKKSRKATAPPALERSPAKTQSPAAMPEFVVGSKITHPMFGDGTVSEVDSDKLTIHFAHGRLGKSSPPSSSADRTKAGSAGHGCGSPRTTTW